MGVGTLYRRFSSLDDLMAVVLEEKMRRYAERTEQAAEHSVTEPWEALQNYVMFTLEQQATDAAFSDVLLAPGGGTELFRDEMSRAFRASVLLVERVKESGVVREDFDHSDLYMLQHAARGLLRGTQRSAPLAWKRLGEYMLLAFRAREGELTPPSNIWTRTLAADQA